MKNRFFVFWLVAALLVTAGCQPKTWPVIRSFSDSDEDKPVTAQRPKEENKRPWWKPWGGGSEEQPRKPMAPSQVRPTDAQYKETDYDRAVELAKKFKFEQALPILQNWVQANPNHSEAFRWLGDCYYNLLEYQKAIDAYVQARNLNPDNYLALRGKGFAHLHLGHNYWKQGDQARRSRDMKTAREMLQQAHENYKTALGILQHALRLYSQDDEAMYGRAMAAEGASRKLYSNTIALLHVKKRPEAEVMAQNCIRVIDEGINSANVRIRTHREEIGPRALVGGLFLRRARLLKELGRRELALSDLQKAASLQKSILDEIDPNDQHAKAQYRQCMQLIEQWSQDDGGQE